MDSPSKHQESGWWVFAAGILSLPVLLHPMANPDVFWHLSAAEQILATGALPRVDFFSFTMIGTPWVDFEWLIQLIYYGFYQAAGLWGLFALKVLLLSLAALPIWALTDLHKLRSPLRALLLLFWSALILGRSDLKPETFSVILFSIELWVLEARRLGKLPVLRTAEWAAGAFLFFAFWANLHLAFPAGMVLLAAYGLERPRETWRDTALLLTAAVAGTLANPYGWRLYEVLLEHSRYTAVISQYILEWQPPRLENPYDWPTWLLCALVSVVISVQISWNRRPPAAHLASAVVFGAMFLLHTRQKALFIPIGLLILIDSVRPISKWLRRLQVGPGRYLLIVCVMAYLGYIGHLARPTLLTVGPYSWGLLPVAAADFVSQEHRQFRKRRLFNTWGWGGYLSHRFHPEIRVFMDGRYIFHPLLKEVSEAHHGPLPWQDLLHRYQIEWVLVENSRRLVRVWAPIPGNERRTAPIPYLPVYYPSRRWAAVYRDRQAVLYVRRGAFPEDWIREHEIR